MLAEVKEADELPVLQSAAKSQYMPAPAVLRPDVRADVEAGLLRPDLLQAASTCWLEG